MSDSEKDIVHLIKLTLENRTEDFCAYARRTLARVIRNRPDLKVLGTAVATQLDGSKSALRSAAASEALPVDLDSRFELIRRELSPAIPENIVWPEQVASELHTIVKEREQSDRLLQLGLTPCRSLLFVGPPGVGKTLAARWLSQHLSRPLLTLDLASVMSSYLGKTGNNIRTVLEFSKRNPSILLLDEFDAIAKRRDDSAEVGELKRLVTVILQAIDDWPTSGILIAATNHPELLDPAVWRRFDRIVSFPRPATDSRKLFIRSLLASSDLDSRTDSPVLSMLTAITTNQSFAEIKRELNQLIKKALVSSTPPLEVIEQFIASRIRETPSYEKITWAKQLLALGYSQHKVHSLTGLSRVTIRRHTSPMKKHQIRSGRRTAEDRHGA